MADWSSYSLSDFLLFSSETYFRLFVLYNQAFWPAQVALAALAVLLLYLAWRRRGLRLIGCLIAGAWVLVAWGFFWDRYQTINWAAAYFALGALVEAVLILAVVLSRPTYTRRAQVAGLLLLAFALVVQPLIGPLSGRSWQGLEFFALAPGPTAVASVAYALLVSGLRRWPILPLALAWCAIEAATAWGLDWPAGMIAPAVAVAALLLGYPLQAGWQALPTRPGKAS